MNNNEKLLKAVAEGDEVSRERLISENMGLVHSIATRFIGRGHDFEDICQIGTVGLIKAVDRFDQSFNVMFSTYAVPLIIGEIKKFLRDDGPIKVSRGLKELAAKAAALRSDFMAENKREMTFSELKEALNVETDRLLLALEASEGMLSLYESTDKDSGELLLDRIADKKVMEENAVTKIALRQAFTQLDKRERAVITMRYYKNKTQSQTAQLIGVSQVQISRIEAAAKKKLKKLLG